MGNNTENNLDFEVSSTTLGYEGNSGTIPAALAMLGGTISKDRYTDLVIDHALEAETITYGVFPSSNFGVSMLASAVNPDKLRNYVSVGSVDYPYLDVFDKQFIDGKKEEVAKQGVTGPKAVLGLAKELGYALLQSHKPEDQINDTVKMAKIIEAENPRLRTSLDIVLSEDELKRIREVNTKIGNTSTIWAIEPNKKIGDGTLNDFLQRFIQMRDQNKDLKFGIDLDMGGLPGEDRNLPQILDILTSDTKNNLLPIFLSLSGQEKLENGFRTHLPLGNNVDLANQLGSWIKDRSAKGLSIPSFVIETSPTDPEVLKDYSNFLTNLKKGIA